MRDERRKGRIERILNDCRLPLIIQRKLKKRRRKKRKKGRSSSRLDYLLIVRIEHGIDDYCY